MWLENDITKLSVAQSILSGPYQLFFPLLCGMGRLIVWPLSSEKVQPKCPFKHISQCPDSGEAFCHFCMGAPSLDKDSKPPQSYHHHDSAQAQVTWNKEHLPPVFSFLLLHNKFPTKLSHLNNKHLLSLPHCLPPFSSIVMAISTSALVKPSLSFQSICSEISLS